MYLTLRLGGIPSADGPDALRFEEHSCVCGVIGVLFLWLCQVGASAKCRSMDWICPGYHSFRKRLVASSRRTLSVLRRTVWENFACSIVRYNWLQSLFRMAYRGQRSGGCTVPHRTWYTVCVSCVSWPRYAHVRRLYCTVVEPLGSLFLSLRGISSMLALICKFVNL